MASNKFVIGLAVLAMTCLIHTSAADTKRQHYERYAHNSMLIRQELEKVFGTDPKTVIGNIELIRGGLVKKHLTPEKEAKIDVIIYNVKQYLGGLSEDDLAKIWQDLESMLLIVNEILEKSGVDFATFITIVSRAITSYTIPQR